MKIRHRYLTQATFNALGSKDPGTLYHIEDTQAIYRGATPIVISSDKLNTGSGAQTKAGSLTIQGTLTLSNALGITSGGTGKNSIASGSMLYASASNTLTELVTSSFGRSLLNASSGSVVTGLNADTLDGNHASAFALIGHTHSYVSSVGLSAPTGFSVTGSPITSSGSLTLGFSSGYSITYKGTTSPSSPISGITTWLDTSVSPNQLKKWNGTAWEIVNEVKVGGRNLFGFSKGVRYVYSTPTIDRSVNGFFFTSPSSGIRLRIENIGFGDQGGTFTVSGFIRASAETQINLNMCDVFADKGSSFTVTTTYTYFSLKFSNVMSYVGAPYYGFLDFESTIAGTVIYVKDLMICRGNIAPLSWSPAPEDVQSEIDTKAAIAQTMYIGTTPVNLNRTSGYLALTGISSLAIGTTAAANAKLEILSTTENLRLSYNQSIYSSFNTDTNGNLTINNTGAFVSVLKGMLIRTSANTYRDTNTGSDSAPMPWVASGYSGKYQAIDAGPNSQSYNFIQENTSGNRIRYALINAHMTVTIAGAEKGSMKFYTKTAAAGIVQAMEINDLQQVLIGTTTNPGSYRHVVSGAGYYSSNLSVMGSLTVAGSITASAFYQQS